MTLLTDIQTKRFDWLTCFLYTIHISRSHFLPSTSHSATQLMNFFYGNFGSDKERKIFESNLSLQSELQSIEKATHINSNYNH